MNLLQLKQRIQNANEEDWKQVVIDVLEFLKKRNFTGVKVDAGLDLIIKMLEDMEDEWYYDVEMETIIVQIGEQSIEDTAAGELPGNYPGFEKRDDVLYYIGTEPPVLTDNFAGTHPGLPPHK